MSLKNTSCLLVLAVMLMVGFAAGASNVTVGAARTDQYVPQLKGKRVALFSNHTGMVGDRHTLDIMLGNGLNRAFDSLRRKFFENNWLTIW